MKEEVMSNSVIGEITGKKIRKLLLLEVIWIHGMLVKVHRMMVPELYNL